MAPTTSTAVAPTRQKAIQKMKDILYGIIGPADRSMLPFIPRPIKILVAILFILNWRSWPFVWHWKVWRSVFAIRFDAWRKVKDISSRRKWLSQRSCVNADPFEVVSKLECYAGVDDCDYNMHLSNSAYAKNVDSARMKMAMDLFLPIFGDSGWMPLGGAQYHFIREIPMGTNYEIRTSVGAWEEKWMYIVHHYISYPSKSSKPKSAKNPPTTNPSIGTPSTPALIDTPPQSISPPPFVVPRPAYNAPSTVPAFKLRTPLPEGAVVHCVAISLYCFKSGRLTIPPRVALITAGYGDPSKMRWLRIQGLRYANPSKKKADNKMKDILKGGWKTDAVDGWEKSSRGDYSSFWDLDEFEDRRVEAVRNVFSGFQSSLNGLKERDV